MAFGTFVMRKKLGKLALGFFVNYRPTSITDWSWMKEKCVLQVFFMARRREVISREDIVETKQACTQHTKAFLYGLKEESSLFANTNVSWIFRPIYGKILKSRWLGVSYILWNSIIIYKWLRNRDDGTNEGLDIVF